MSVVGRESVENVLQKYLEEEVAKTFSDRKVKREVGEVSSSVRNDYHIIRELELKKRNCKSKTEFFELIFNIIKF